jgi:hypothetical protein
LLRYKPVLNVLPERLVLLEIDEDSSTASFVIGHELNSGHDAFRPVLGEVHPHRTPVPAPASTG